MATLAAHGTELARIKTLTALHSHRSDGHILQNEGGGWRLWCKVTNPIDYARKALARQAKLIKICPAHQAYKLALHELATLSYWSAITSHIAERLDMSIWYDFYPLQPSPEQWQELGRLYRAMEMERETTT